MRKERFARDEHVRVGSHRAVRVAGESAVPLTAMVETLEARTLFSSGGSYYPWQMAAHQSLAGILVSSHARDTHAASRTPSHTNWRQGPSLPKGLQLSALHAELQRPDQAGPHPVTPAPSSPTPPSNPSVPSNPTQPTAPAVPSSTQDVVSANNQFAWDLYAQLSKQSGNVFFSPLSVSTALAMAAAGARGETLTQMLQTLHLTGDPSEAFGQLLQQLQSAGQGHAQLHMADGMWTAQDLKLLDSFVHTLTGDYNAQAANLDFAGDPDGARQIINQWVADQTNQRITNLLPAGSVTSNTAMVLANAIYFLGHWAKQFPAYETYNGEFTELSGQQITTPLMQQTSYFKYYDSGSFQAVEMPYEGGDKSMVIFLPKQTDGLTSLEGQLTATSVEQWMGEMKPTNVHITLPKFNITTDTISLTSTLEQMGMVEPFSGDADFSGITGDQSLSISGVYHKAYITVAENGTEAAAATGIAVVTSCMPIQPPVDFRADHPFVFMIRDTNTGSTLFAGRVEQPVAPTASQGVPA